MWQLLYATFLLRGPGYPSTDHSPSSLMYYQLSVTDKFLKEVSVYHPDAFKLYCSFIFIYHILRVRSEVGHISSYKSILLSDMLVNYPPSSLPVPGTIADLLQSITRTKNPYPWLGNNTTALPEVTDFTAPTHSYCLNQDRH
jgi:hypothetical protein